MPKQSAHFRLATPKDSNDILSLLEQNDFKGRINIIYTRRPDPYQSLLKEGQNVQIFLGKDEDSEQPVSIGACSVNPMWLNNTIQNVGYMFGIRLKKGKGAHIRYFPEGYRYHFHHMNNLKTNNYLTTIIESNQAAITFFEKEHKNLPIYDFIGNIETLSFKTGIKASIPTGWSFDVIQENEIDPLRAFYRSQRHHYQYFPIIEEQDLRLGLTTPTFDNFYCLKDNHGRILAAGAVWDQQSYKQYIVQGYSGSYRLLRPFSKWLLPWLGYPSLPTPKSKLNFFVLGFLLAKNNHAPFMQTFLSAMLNQNKQYNFCSFALHEKHPLLPVIKQRPHLVYKSRLYRVFERPAKPQPLTGLPYIEIGRL